MKKIFKCKNCKKRWFKVILKDRRFILICKKCKREYKLKKWVNSLINENPVYNRFNDFTQHEEAILLELLRTPNPTFICLDEGMEGAPHESTRKALLKELEDSD